MTRHILSFNCAYKQWLFNWVLHKANLHPINIEHVKLQLNKYYDYLVTSQKIWPGSFIDLEEKLINQAQKIAK